MDYLTVRTGVCFFDATLPIPESNMEYTGFLRRYIGSRISIMTLGQCVVSGELVEVAPDCVRLTGTSVAEIQGHWQDMPEFEETIVPLNHIMSVSVAEVPVGQPDLFVHRLELEIGGGLIDAARGELSNISQLRTRLKQEIGITLPIIRVVDNPQLGDREFRLKMRNLVIAEGEVEDIGDILKDLEMIGRALV